VSPWFPQVVACCLVMLAPAWGYAWAVTFCLDRRQWQTLQSFRESHTSRDP